MLTLPLSGVARASILSRKADEAKKLRVQIMENQKALNRTVSAYQKAKFQLEAIKSQLTKIKKQLAKTQLQLARAQEVLNLRVENLYKTGDANVLDVIFNAQDFGDFVSRLDVLGVIASQDAKRINAVLALKSELEDQMVRLENAKLKQQTTLRNLSKQRKKLEAGLKRQKALLAKAQKDLRLLKLRSRRISISRGGERILSMGFVFPVAGTHAFGDSWGDARSSGRRHEGTDIFAPMGTPAVAANSGVVYRVHHTSQGLGGITLWIRSTDGNSYYYAHLQRVAGGIHEGTRVRAGQVVGYVGNTGNARGGSPHLHFEIHPGGGGAINPYAILRASE